MVPAATAITHLTTVHGRIIHREASLGGGKVHASLTHGRSDSNFSHFGPQAAATVFRVLFLESHAPSRVACSPSTTDPSPSPAASDPGSRPGVHRCFHLLWTLAACSLRVRCIAQPCSRCSQHGAHELLDRSQACVPARPTRAAVKHAGAARSW